MTKLVGVILRDDNMGCHFELAIGPNHAGRTLAVGDELHILAEDKRRALVVLRVVARCPVQGLPLMAWLYRCKPLEWLMICYDC